jgi:hypothetical protein
LSTRRTGTSHSDYCQRCVGYHAVDKEVFYGFWPEACKARKDFLVALKLKPCDAIAAFTERANKWFTSGNNE